MLKLAYMNNLICVVGPTATGKTRLAEEIRKSFDFAQDDRKHKLHTGVELLSVDSRQIYVGMDVGTGKDAKIFGTDLVKPEKLFNVSDFVKIIRPKIEELWKKNILPILVGGTGLYLKAVIDGIETMDVPPDENLRKRLEKMSVEELQNQVQGQREKIKGGEKWPAMNNSDWNNRRRLIRRVEILTNTIQCHPILSNTNKLKIDKLIMIGLRAQIEQIAKNIEKRVKERLTAGLLEEIENLVKKYGWNEVLRNTIAYREWEDYFSEKITKEQAILKWTKDEVDYAKRQMTWFRKDKRIRWIDISTEDSFKQSFNLINALF